MGEDKEGERVSPGPIAAREAARWAEGQRTGILLRRLARIYGWPDEDEDETGTSTTALD